MKKLLLIITVIFFTAFNAQSQDCYYMLWSEVAFSNASVPTNSNNTGVFVKTSGTCIYNISFNIAATIIAKSANTSHGGAVYINGTRVILGGVGSTGSMTAGVDANDYYNFTFAGTPVKYSLPGAWIDVRFDVEAVRSGPADISCGVSSPSGFTVRFTK